MLKGWETKKIKYCAKLSPSCDTSKLTPDSEVTFTPMECIKNGYFINQKATFSALGSSYTQYQEGDIVIAKVTPCFENGNISEMCGLYSGFGFGSSELFVLRPHNIKSHFFFYALQNEEFIKRGSAAMTGTGGLKRVSPAFVENYYITIPQPEEQERIARFLDSKCEEINLVLEKTRTSIKEYKQLKQAIITQAVTKGIRGDRPMKESGIEWVGLIPVEWESINPKTLFSQRKEKAIPGERQLTSSQKHGIIYQDDYMELTGSRVVVVQKDFDILKHVEAGDFVISMRSFQGGLEYSTYTGSISSAYVMLIPNLDFVYPRFYRWLLKSESYIHALQSTSNMVRDGQAMRYSNFAQVRLYTLPLQEQKEIANYLDKRRRSPDGPGSRPHGYPW